MIVLVNGDRITGELKELSQGKLDFLTDDAGRLSIEWTKVVAVTSVHRFDLKTFEGKVHVGTLLPLAAGEHGVVHLDTGEVLRIPDVVAIVPLSETFIARFRANLDVGLTVAKSNQARTLTADSFLGYRGERLGTSLAFDAYAQDDANSNAVTRTSLKVAGDLYIERWTAEVWARGERNDELDLRLRLSLGAGAAYAAIRSNFQELTGVIGVVGMRESYGGTMSELDLTGYASVAWNAFRYDSPKLDAGVSLAVYPYLTTVGRTRVEVAAHVKYEIFRNFNVGLSVSDTYDSEPPDPAAAKNDYLLTTVIGWSYRR